MNGLKILYSWGTCSDCGYEGKLEYRHVAGEVYDDAEALGVMLLQRCPGCDTEDHALLPIDYYQGLVTRADADGSEG